MKWVIGLAIRYALRNPVQTTLLAVSLGVTAAIPMASRLIIDRFDQRMTAQASAVPLLVGARGSRFDLVLASVFFREPSERQISVETWNDIAAVPGLEPVQMNAEHTASGRRLVCIGHGAYRRLGLSPAAGSLPLLLGDVTLGASVARELGFTVGDTITTDRNELFDLSVPPPVVLPIVGVLEPTGTSIDDVVFASIDTAWVVGGQTHSHAEGEELSSEDIIAAGDNAIAVRPTLQTETTINPSNIATFHGHNDPSLRPLTAVLVFADDPKPITIAAARIDSDPALQAVRPVVVVEELLGVVLRVQRVFDAITALLAVASLLLVMLTSALAARLRSDEFAVLESVGAPRGTASGLLFAQIAVVAVAAAVIALVLVVVALAVSAGMNLA